MKEDQENLKEEEDDDDELIECSQSDTSSIIKSTLNKKLIGLPILSLFVALVIYPFIETFSWTPYVITPGILLFFFILITYKSCIKKAKAIILIDFLSGLFIIYFFSVIGTICFSTLFSKKIFIIEIILKSFIIFCFFVHYYTYWINIWKKYKDLNENIFLDLVNGRFDYMSFITIREPENEAQKRSVFDKKMSSILPYAGPVGIGIGLSFGGVNFVYITIIVLSLMLSFYMPKYICVKLSLYGLLISYEKEIGKPILNGLLEDKKEN